MKTLHLVLCIMFATLMLCPEKIASQYLIDQTGYASPCISANDGEQIRFVQTKSINQNGTVSKSTSNIGVIFNFSGNYAGYDLGAGFYQSFKYSHKDSSGNSVWYACNTFNGRESIFQNTYLLINPERTHINAVREYGNQSNITVYERQDTPQTQQMIY